MSNGLCRGQVDKYLFSPFEIQHAIIRGNTNPNKELFAKNDIESPTDNMMQMEEKKVFMFPRIDPLVNFGFYFPYKSNPPLKLFISHNVKDQLKEAAQDYLDKTVSFKEKNKLKLPGFLNFYKYDFNAVDNELIDFIEQHLPLSRKRDYEQWLVSRSGG
eukprot:TRINITY_DN6211_c0_g1_i3.p1 TRINITY_DN6211_c0_g1~~TRINITY_DN6211_c0_g1_i3.p1  ORF type:complete len:159 (+),score=30.37 TRINITY_DN6211_c0_g1_i3:606-1082(+)